MYYASFGLRFSSISGSSPGFALLFLEKRSDHAPQYLPGGGQTGSLHSLPDFEPNPVVDVYNLVNPSTSRTIAHILGLLQKHVCAYDRASIILLSIQKKPSMKLL